MSERQLGQLKSLRSDLEAEIKKIDEVMDRSKASLKDSKKNFENKHKQLENESLEQIQAVIDPLRSTQQRFGEKTPLLMQTMDEILSTVRQISSQLEETSSAVSQKPGTMKNELERSLDEKKSATAQLISNSVKAILGSHKTSLEEIHQKEEQALDDLFLKVERLIQSQQAGEKELTNSLFADLKRALENFNSKAGKISDQRENEITRSFDKAKNDIIATFESQSADLAFATDDTLKDLGEKLDGEKERIGTAINQIRTEFSSNVDQTVKKIDQSSQEARSGSAQFKQQEQERVQGLASSLIGELENNLKVSAKEGQEILTASKESQAQTLNNLMGFVQSFSAVHDQISSEIGTLSSTLEIVAQNLRSSVDRLVKKDFKTNIVNVIRTLEKNMNNTLNQLTKSLDRETKGIYNRSKKTLTDYDSQFRQGVEGLDSRYASSVGSSLGSARDEVLSFQQNISSSIQQSINEVSTNVDNLKTQFEKKMKEFSATNKKMFDTTAHHASDTLQRDMKNVLMVVSEVPALVEDMAIEFNRNVGEASKKFESLFKASSEGFLKEKSSSQANLISQIQTQKDQLEKTATTRLEEAEKNLAGTSQKYLEEETRKLGSFLDEVSRGFQSTMSMVNEMRETSLKTIGEMKTEFTKTLEAFMESLEYDERSLEEKKKNLSEILAQLRTSSIKDTEDLARGVEQRAKGLKSSSSKLKSSTDNVIKELEN